jgi:hypothetical protein
MERRDLYEDDLTEERQITPAQRDDVARTEILDPDVLDTGTVLDDGSAEVDDDDDDDDDDEDDEDDDEDDLG